MYKFQDDRTSALYRIFHDEKNLRWHGNSNPWPSDRHFLAGKLLTGICISPIDHLPLLRSHWPIFSQEKSFAGVGIQTHDLPTRVFLPELFLFTTVLVEALAIQQLNSEKMVVCATLADSGAPFKFLNGAINGWETILWQKLGLMVFLPQAAITWYIFAKINFIE